MKILVTGFEPFGGQAVNPSAELVTALMAAPPPGIALAAEILPCTFAAMPPPLEAALERHRPEAVLGFGLAGGRSVVSIERVGINVIDARIADNEGAQPLDVPVVEGGPAAYFATIPIKAAYARLTAAGLPAEISQTAGTFVCNAMLYSCLHLAAPSGIRAGFVHVPYLPDMAPEGMPSLDFSIMLRVATMIVKTLSEVREDFRVSAGAVS